ncbi:MAG: hypothetical protein GY733_04535, partial [bacterium]|nr:hypothetical protein [bacterium]
MKVESIGVCLKPDQPDGKEVVGRLVAWAERRGIAVRLDGQAAREQALPATEREALCAESDLVIAVGVSLGSSVLFLRYRDLNQVWEVVLQAGFFIA